MGKITREHAAYVLEDEIGNAQLSLERAEIVLHEMTDNFFNNNKFNPYTENGQLSISIEYPRYTIYADIVKDYLFRLRKQLQELMALSLADRATRETKGGE